MKRHHQEIRISIDDTPEDLPHTDNLNVTFDRTGYELEDLIHSDIVLVEPHEPLIVVPESVHIEELYGAEDSYKDTEDNTPASSMFDLHNTEDEDFEDVSLQYSFTTLSGFDSLQMEYIMVALG